MTAGAAEPAGPSPNLTSAQYQQMVKDTLAELAANYQQEDLRGFMKLVSSAFVGDDYLLYRAVRRDFRFFDDIVLRVDIDGFAVDPKGRAQVTVKYNRAVIANKDSRPYRDSGLTQLTFTLEDGRAKLYDMKFPMIFGLSEGLQVASGVVRSAETAMVIVIDRRGNVYLLPFQDAVAAADGNSVVRGIVTLQTDGAGMDCFSFADNRKIRSITLQGDFAVGPNLMFKHGTKWLRLITGFDSVNRAPDPATYLAEPSTSVAAGEVYALRLANGKFAVMEIRAFYQPGGDAWTTIVRYKYQPSGSRSF